MDTSVGKGTQMEYLLWFVICAAVGGAIGRAKGRPSAGTLFGFLLGPIGWLLVAIGPNMGPKCSECGGNVVPGARKCKNCGSTIG